ncbi:HAD-like domain-containing protein [Gilbertella persicaria]|uniref:HAD-like domain-containing protein n=1 Tax=Gilbertella persicaria TaxID=101096 RepID=UPI00221FA0BE|nr:HAD-like domain-containing protein [Gilbertella persicaria]KAI8068135.1 HAD-like domain-containing protein [Gilbertella persicaria]
MCCALKKKKKQKEPVVEKEMTPVAPPTPPTPLLPESDLVDQALKRPSSIEEKEFLTEDEDKYEQVTKSEEATLDDSNVTFLLNPIEKEHRGRKCLVLDLDETLIHSSFKTVAEADFIVPVEIDGHYHNVFVLKRPGVDDFMRKMGELYEIVIFTASLSKYADPVLDKFDLHHVIHHRLFRESCHPYKGTFIKDLSRLGRDLKHVIILDNTPTSYSFHPSNAVPVSTWFNDQHDSELIDLIPFLQDLSKVDDVVEVLNTSF